MVWFSMWVENPKLKITTTLITTIPTIAAIRIITNVKAMSLSLQSVMMMCWPSPVKSRVIVWHLKVASKCSLSKGQSWTKKAKSSSTTATSLLNKSHSGMEMSSLQMLTILPSLSRSLTQWVLFGTEINVRSASSLSSCASLCCFSIAISTSSAQWRYLRSVRVFLGSPNTWLRSAFWGRLTGTSKDDLTHKLRRLL